jgi:hypothetical protein
MRFVEFAWNPMDYQRLGHESFFGYLGNHCLRDELLTLATARIRQAQSCSLILSDGMFLATRALARGWRRGELRGSRTIGTDHTVIAVETNAANKRHAAY